MKGYIRSIESFGTLDGPGIRLVIFFQGCPLRCKYCHNPETRLSDRGQETTAEELLSLYEKNKAFYSRGGITATGGEPLVQIDFLTELFQKAKGAGIHTCLDTSGVTFNRNDAERTEKFRRLLEVTDLVMLDIKHIDSEKHVALTGFPNENILDFALFLGENRIRTTIRHVVVPNLTDDPKDLEALGRFIGRIPTITKPDVLPYHTLGVHKYGELGIPYPLEGVPQATKEDAERARDFILSGIKKTRQG